jgi:lipopolysaccharide export system permease protein
MTILDRYILREVTRTILICLIAFVAVFISMDMVEYVDDFVDNDVGAFAVFKYYLYQVPHIFTLTLPVAVLISCLFTVGQMSRHYELIAIKASGIRFARTMVPLLLAGFVASLISLGVSELIVPTANSKVKSIKANEIKKSSRRGQPRMRTNISYRGREGHFYFSPQYDTKLNVMKNVVVEKSVGSHMIYRLNASQAAWKESSWVFTEAYIRWFSEDGEVAREQHMAEGSLPGVTDHPRSIIQEQRQPEEMGYGELANLVARIVESGGDPTRYRVGLHMKIAFPFTNLIVVLIGAPLSARLRRGGIAVGVGLGMTITFIYYGFIRVGQTIGDHGSIPPLPAAWLGNVFFAICGIILILREEKL